MAERLSGAIEHTAYSATGVLTGATLLGWINHNAQAIVAICAIITCIVGIIAAVFRHIETKRRTSALIHQRRRASDEAE